MQFTVNVQQEREILHFKHPRVWAVNGMATQTFRKRKQHNNNNTTKIRSSRDSVRKARESHLIDKAMTLEPHGLNRRDELL